MDYNARYYSAYLGRFVSPDSIIPDGGNSMDWDRYQYAWSNPVMYNDPSGHDVGCPASNPECQEMSGIAIGDRYQDYIKETKQYRAELISQYGHLPSLRPLINITYPKLPPNYSITKYNSYSSGYIPDRYVNNRLPFEITAPWDDTKFSGLVLHLDGGGGYYVVGINGSIDIVANRNSNKAGVFFTPSGLIGLGIGASFSIGLGKAFNVRSNSDLIGWVSGAQLTLIPELGLATSYSRSDGVSVPEMWAATIGSGGEISLFGSRGYSFLLFEFELLPTKN